MTGFCESSNADLKKAHLHFLVAKEIRTGKTNCSGFARDESAWGRKNHLGRDPSPPALIKEKRKDSKGETQPLWGNRRSRRTKAIATNQFSRAVPARSLSG